jgi:hypothetical protein
MRFTVFAVYEDNMQPFCTTVEAPADDPKLAIALAQEEADNDNGSHNELVGVQVARGEVEVVL